jgi:bifunctional non-homologous end joining protein LigD
VAFDLLWCNGQELRCAPLMERKHRLRSILPKRSEHVIHCDHVERDGKSLFRLAREQDLEGIVAKRKSDPYFPNHAEWLKIRNRAYYQWEGRQELFE